MKKLVGFLLILTVHIALCSCTAMPINTDTAETPTQSKTTALAMVAQPSIESFSEYEQFIAENYADSPDFITYETIKELGSFVKFAYYDYFDGEYYELTEKAEFIQTNKRYWYLLENSQGKKLFFDIECANGIDRSGIPEFPESVRSTNNLYRIEGANGTYRSGRIYYYYYNDILTQVGWTEGEYLYKIQSCQNDMSQIIDSENGLISRLINIETAEAAVDEFNAKVAAARAEKAD